MEPSEFECPFCDQWTPIADFQKHIAVHNAGSSFTFPGWSGTTESPKTIEDMRRRFQPLGMYQER